ncbi:MAG TPA: hypothetical protein VIJ53_05995, partial [Acidobacteriaceae bacterium]
SPRSRIQRPSFVMPQIGCVSCVDAVAVEKALLTEAYGTGELLAMVIGKGELPGIKFATCS